MNNTTDTRRPLPVVKDSLTPQTGTPRADACPHYSIVQLEQGDKITTQCTKCGKKMRVVKKPKCSCYGGFDCEICNPDYYEEMTTIDTPRTDSNSTERERILANALDKAIEMGAKAEAEVERLKEQLELYRAANADVKRIAEERNKAEANFRRAIEIADVLRGGGSRACRELHHAKKEQHEYGEICPVEERLDKAESELDALKETLNQHNK